MNFTSYVARKNMKQESRSNYAYEILKKRIISLELTAGQHLVEENIAEELSVSRTPVRQALQRLQNEDFVTMIPYSGCIVRQFTVADIDEIYTIREALEGICVFRATKIISEKNLDLIENTIQADLKKCLHKNTTAVKSQKIQDLLHDMSVELCGNNRIVQIMKKLAEQIKLLQHYSLSLPGRKKQSCYEHQDILNAMRKRNQSEAEQLMREHIRSVKNDVIKYYLNSRIHGLDEKELKNYLY
jgi:DNA-binding GntR family transcriptional regulator